MLDNLTFLHLFGEEMISPNPREKVEASRVPFLLFDSSHRHFKLFNTYSHHIRTRLASPLKTLRLLAPPIALPHFSSDFQALQASIFCFFGTFRLLPSLESL